MEQAIMGCVDVHIVLAFCSCGQGQRFQSWEANKQQVYWQQSKGTTSRGVEIVGQKRKKLSSNVQFLISMKEKALPIFQLPGYGMMVSLILLTLEMCWVDLLMLRFDLDASQMKPSSVFSECNSTPYDYNAQSRKITRIFQLIFSQVVTLVIYKKKKKKK
eukprot:739182_1